MPPKQDAFFESLYSEHFRQLRLQALSKIKNPSVAEELVQDTFCTALQKAERFRHYENPGGYLSKILYFKVCEYKRARQRYLRLFLSLEKVPLSEAEAPSNPIPTSTSIILETARNALSEKDWYILEQFALKGASHLEISRTLGITPQASQKRLERIRKKLEEVLPDF